MLEHPTLTILCSKVRQSHKDKNKNLKNKTISNKKMPPNILGSIQSTYFLTKLKTKHTILDKKRLIIPQR